MLLVASLLEAIDRLDQLENKARAKIVLKSFRLGHVDIMVHVSIEECSGDVYRVQLKVLKYSNSPQGYPLGCGSKYLRELKS